MTIAGDRFRVDLRALLAKARTNHDLIVRKIILDMGRRLVELSPVGDPELWASKYHPKGYVGGRFRANWQYGQDAAPSGELLAPGLSAYPDAEATLAELASTVPADGLTGHKHYLVNNLPYAQRLEDGWSTQAPGGMVAITVTEFQQYVDNAVRSLP